MPFSEENDIEQLAHICTAYHHIDIQHIYKIIDTLVYHLIYNNQFNSHCFKESMIIRTLNYLFRNYPSNKKDMLDNVIYSYRGYIQDEIRKHKQLKNDSDDEKKRSKCCKSCL